MLLMKESWREVKRWWNNQSSRWYDGKCINSNKYDIIKNRELRQKIAPFLQQLFKGEGACNFCKWPWSLVDSHTTMMSEGYGVFVLCEYCWNHLRSYGKEDIIRRLYHQSRTRFWHDMKEQELDIALNKDLGRRLE